MFRNFWIVAARNFWRNKVFSIINISGLAIGISAALVIYLIVQYEFSFEKFRKDKDRSFRVVSDMHFPDMEFKNSGVPGPLPPAVRAGISGIESSTTFWLADGLKVNIPNENGKENTFKKQKGIVYADEYYFRFFPYQFIAGSADNALNEPNKVVLTETRAKTYFSFSDISNAIGQTIVYDDTVKATVTGVVKDIKGRTDINPEEFVSLITYKKTLETLNSYHEWGSLSSSSQYFVKLKKGVSPVVVAKQINDLRKKSFKEEYMGTDHFLQPISDIHFNGDYDALDNRQGHKPTLYGLLAVAAFLLILGCINFINLTTAQAVQRAKEIGIRKTMGSSRYQLVLQFLSETFLLTLVAALVSIAITPSVLEMFRSYIPDGVHFTINLSVILFLLGLVAAVSFLSGFYPALLLSKYKPVVVLKNLAYADTAKSRKAWVRKTLTVSQFVIAQFFIIATLIVGKQIRYSLNKDLGFKKDAIVFFNTPMNWQNPDDKQFVLQQKLKSIPGIEKLSLAGTPPAARGWNVSTMKFKKDGKETETSVEIKLADTAYFDLYKMKLLAGSYLRQSDTSREYLINETYMKQLGYTNPADIVGKTIDKGNGSRAIAGVLADINSKSLHSGIKPLVYTSAAQESNYFHVALGKRSEDGENWKKTIAGIGAAWKEVYPEEEFKYEFVDESIAKFYEKETQVAGLLNWCMGLTIFISCLGLLGLVMYTTSQRIKEIGVRKVLGASVTQIVALLSKDFMTLVVLAILIAAPLAWWAMNEWLQDFAYRTSVSWWVFALSGIAMIIVALLTLSVQTVRSALRNPVKSLRTE